jgi:two-component system, OmpR family, response regulator
MSEQDSRPAHILVVEDDPAMRNIVVNYLEDHNIRAVGTPARQQMMSLLANDAPRLVILDLNLGSGLDLLRKIRSRSNVP